MADIYKYDLLGYAGQTPNLYNIMNDARAYQLRRGQQDLQQQEQTRLQEEYQQKMAQQQSLMAGVNAYWKHPTPEALSQLIMTHPEAQEALAKGGDIADKEHKRQAFSDASGMWMKSVSNPTGVADDMQTRLDAGEPDDDGTHAAIIKLLRGTPEEQKRGNGLLLANAYRYADDKEGFMQNAKEYFPGEPQDTAFMRNYAFLKEKNPDLADAYLRAEAEGRPFVAYDENNQPVLVSPGQIPRYGGGTPAAPATPAPAANGTQVVQDDQGNPHVMSTDKATGLKVITSEKWGPGVVAYVTRSKQEYDRVPVGQMYVAPDGQTHIKGQKK